MAVGVRAKDGQGHGGQEQALHGGDAGQRNKARDGQIGQIDADQGHQQILGHFHGLPPHRQDQGQGGQGTGSAQKTRHPHEPQPGHDRFHQPDGHGDEEHAG